MPRFLEAALRHDGKKRGLSGPELDKYVYAAMNNSGAMHGSQETAKGAEMQKKHDADKKSSKRTKRKGGVFF